MRSAETVLGIIHIAEDTGEPGAPKGARPVRGGADGKGPTEQLASRLLHCSIYVRSRRASERVMAGVTRFLERRLKLKVNREKSAVARPVERKFLGFSLTPGRQPKRRIAPSALARFKSRIRELTRRTGGKSL